MTTRRPISELVKKLFVQFSIKTVATEDEVAEFIQDWLDEDNASYILKENEKYFVCKLDSVHNPSVLAQGKGFSFLKKGDLFDFSPEDFYRAHGQGRVYQATSDFKNGRICANERYNPEI
jgi:hypothetical protein